jgi:hypothetical protein
MSVGHYLALWLERIERSIRKPFVDSRREELGTDRYESA